MILNFYLIQSILGRLKVFLSSMYVSIISIYFGHYLI